MSTRIATFIFAVSLWVTGCTDSNISNVKFPKGKVQIAHHAAKIKWVPCPPTLPKGCEMTVLEGHPKKENLFTVRFKTIADFYMPAHTHPKDERVTMLEGKVAVAFGVHAKREEATEFGPGDFYINARDQVHHVWIDKGTILQINGVGPWAANFIKENNPDPVY